MCQLNVPMTTPQLQHQRPWAINVHLQYRSYPCGRSRRRPGTDEAVPSAGAAKAACSSERQCGSISRYHCRKLVGRRTRRLGRRSERRHRRRNVHGPWHMASAESALDSATFASNASALLRRFLYDCPNLAGLSGSLHRTALSGSLHPFPPHTFLGRPLLPTYRAGLVKSTAGESGISLFALRDARPAIPLRILQVGRWPRDAWVHSPLNASPYSHVGT